MSRVQETQIGGCATVSCCKFFGWREWVNELFCVWRWVITHDIFTITYLNIYI